MLSYAPGDSIAHRLDPRSKLAVQAGFAAAALAYTTPVALAALTALAAGIAAASEFPLRRTARSLRYPALLLAAGPLVAALTLGPPWFEPSAAVEPALGSYRVLLVLVVSAAYVRTTPVSESRAAIQRTIPGKAGQLLGVGIALVFRFLPVIRGDLRRIQRASAARLGTERGAVERATTVGVLGLERTFRRADRLSLALQARCFSWGPTLPALSLSRRDLPALALAAGLALSALLRGARAVGLL
ncbi:energy-coupling factor transporter transmembrane component T family protein [Saliphagus infecundisoli]|uniref:Energy-coupling factor transporter transmembrane component T family protein n=1 Tax=Saliphagus infecundisoli TaxID=1849069 RepID=A0ABD5QL02_9EURY|nr:energy-coupling factor transporter transmembrane protein EcfT [Saliphagus infecundisoli]